jgi:hypothetical protein
MPLNTPIFCSSSNPQSCVSSSSILFLYARPPSFLSPLCFRWFVLAGGLRRRNASSGGREDNGGATAAAGGSGKWAVTPTTPTATSGVTHAPPLPLPLPLLDVMKAAVTASASDPALRWTHQWNRRMKPLVLNMIFERLQVGLTATWSHCSLSHSLTLPVTPVSRHCQSH